MIDAGGAGDKGGVVDVDPARRLWAKAQPVSNSAADTARLAHWAGSEFGFVWRVLRRMGVAESDADDGAQQVFIAFSRNIASVRIGCERAFLFSTAVHVAMRVRRGRARKREAFGLDLDQRPDPSGSQEDLLGQRHAREVLDSLLEQMPLELRIVLVLFELEQLTTQEIAKVIEVPPGTVASRLRRARDDLTARVARLEAGRNFRGRSDV